jgi:hypothetical protein
MTSLEILSIFARPGERVSMRERHGPQAEVVAVGITGCEVRSALVDPQWGSPGRVEWWHRCCTSLLHVTS